MPIYRYSRDYVCDYARMHSIYFRFPVVSTGTWVYGVCNIFIRVVVCASGVSVCSDDSVRVCLL